MTSFSSQEKNKIKNILLWMTTLGQASLAIYLPAFPVIANELAMTPTMVAQTITFFMIGFGASPFFYGPLSDRYGRKPILLISLSIACVGYLINIFANDGFLFLSARLIEGVGCGGLLIGGRSIMRDVFSGRELASAASYLSMAFAIGFGLTPVIGGYLSTHLNWRFSFGVLLMMTFLIMLMLFLYLPETNFEKENRTPLKHFLAQTFSAYRQIFIHFSFLKFLLGGVFAYGVVVAYNVMTPFLLQGPFGLSALQYGYLAPLMGIPYFLGAF
jgi:DHA1 family 2-module integral membrane pump EmrD-like MFS transporter